jgi:hypothetical protein
MFHYIHPFTLVVAMAVAALASLVLCRNTAEVRLHFNLAGSLASGLAMGLAVALCAVAVGSGIYDTQSAHAILGTFIVAGTPVIALVSAWRARAPWAAPTWAAALGTVLFVLLTFLPGAPNAPQVPAV